MTIIITALKKAISYSESLSNIGLAELLCYYYSLRFTTDYIRNVCAICLANVESSRCSALTLRFCFSIKGKHHPTPALTVLHTHQHQLTFSGACPHTHINMQGVFVSSPKCKNFHEGASEVNTSKSAKHSLL